MKYVWYFLSLTFLVLGIWQGIQGYWLIAFYDATVCALAFYICFLTVLHETSFKMIERLLRSQHEIKTWIDRYEQTKVDETVSRLLGRED